MTFEGVPPPGIIDLHQALKRENEKLKLFKRVINLLITLADAEAYEVRMIVKNGTEQHYLLFGEEISGPTKANVADLKRLLGISLQRNAFRISDRITDVKSEEISLQTRSLTAMLAFLAKGVQVPPEHLAAGMVIDYQIPISENMEEDLIPFRMLNSEKRPENPFAAVRYLDRWYYIDNRDFNSKRALGHVIALFRLLAPSGGGAKPVLTLQAG
jgi:hypothetical protein